MQYPHYLYAVEGADSIQDASGNWINTQSTNVFISACREETDGRGSEIKVAGGTFHRFTSLIQLPKGALTVEVGTRVFIANNANGTDIRISGVVLKYDKGVYHSRLWI